MPTDAEREDSDEMIERLVRSLPLERVLRNLDLGAVLACFTVEERLAGLTPAQVLATLTPDERLLALPTEVLRGLSEDYLRTLPEHVQGAIRARLAGSK